MAVKRKGLGRGLDALFPEKSIAKKTVSKSTVENQEAAVNQDTIGQSTGNQGTENQNVENQNAVNQNAVNQNTVNQSALNQGTGNKDIANTDSAISNMANKVATDNGRKETEKKNRNEGSSEQKKSEMLVKISKVEPNRNQPRKQFDEDALVELSESIKQYGVLQPLLVSDKGEYYEIIAGERRWRAAKLAGLKEVPVIIKEFNNQQVVEISLLKIFSGKI